MRIVDLISALGYITSGFTDDCTLRSYVVFIIIIDNFSCEKARVETIWRVKFDTGQAELNIISSFGQNNLMSSQRQHS